MAKVFGKLKFQSAMFRNSIYLKTYSNFSTPACAIPDQISHFRTSENNPIHHTHNHVGKFYRIENTLKQRLFFNGGIPKQLDIQMETFRENCIMIREPFLEMLSLLKNINFSNPAVRVVIYGRNGTGKTTSLIHLIHYAYLSKFLLLHIPWVSIWTKRPKEVVASQYNEVMIDLPVESSLWLQHFKLQNANLMKELDLKTSESYTWSKREVTEQGEPLMNIVEHGMQRVRHSSDCIAVLLKEIKYHSQFNKFRTMVVIDGVNAFFNKTNVKRPDKTMVPPNEITICNAFMKMLKNDWNMHMEVHYDWLLYSSLFITHGINKPKAQAAGCPNNAVIITTVDILPFNRHFTMQDPYTPRVLLGKEGFELLNPFIPIATYQYSEKEIESVLDYYIDRLWIQSETARSEGGRKQLKFLSGYNPHELMDICKPL